MNSASTSPSSQSPGEPVQRDIDGTSVRQSLRGPPTSPRNAILSQTSLQQPVPEPTSASIAESRSHGNRALEKRRDVHKKSSSERRKRSTRAPSDLSLLNLSRLDIDRLRNDPKAEAFKMRDLLETAVRQVHVESKRAEELQRINDEAATKFRLLNENRLSAQQEAAKAKTELKLYQFQLDSAQKEIEKAKTALKEIEKQRDEAEDAAARAREKARKYHQERLVAGAREDGRKLGYEAGLKHAKREKEILAAGRPRSVPQPPSRSSKGKERAHFPEEDDHHSRSRHDNASSPEYSTSHTHKRNFRPSNQPARPNPRMRPGSTAPQRFRPRGREEVEDDEEDEEDYESESEEEHPPSRPVRATTPSIQVWPVDIPAADKLNESFNSNEHPNDAINQGPRERWVTAHQHHEIRHPNNPPMRSNPIPSTKSPIVLPHTPQLVPASNIQFISPGSASGPPQFGGPPPGSIMIFPHPGVAPHTQQQQPLVKSVKFWAKRPTLAKTKQQATSWYRSLSLRKKNKPVIDPIPEESTASPHSGAPVIPNFPEPHSASDSPEVAKLYGPRPQQTQSWYRSGGAPSLRNHDMSYARRQQSDAASVVSTRVSQFDLLSTPALHSVTSIPLPRTKNKGHVKEKESLLSVIKEVSSRGNTPERPLGVGGPTAGTHSMPQPNYPPGFLETGRASSSGSVPNRRRPPTIHVPDPDSAGVGYQSYSSNPNLHRKNSIGIDVVPPSGRVPDNGTSPPHTGQNHLSPYHVYRPEESIRSLRDAIDSFAQQPARPDSSNRRPGYSRTGSAGAGPSGQYGQGSPLQNPRPPFMTWAHGSSGSASASNRPLRNTASTATFKVANPDPPQPDNRSSRTRASSRARPMLADIVGNGEDAGVVLTPRREPSRASLKSTKSYSRYNPDEYVDPAFWGVNGPGDPPAALPAQPRPGMQVDATDMERAASRLSRRMSVDSGLSYA